MHSVALTGALSAGLENSKNGSFVSSKNDNGSRVGLKISKFF